MPTLAEMEMRAILRRMKVMAGNYSAAAKSLGISRSTLYAKLERYRLEKERRPFPDCPGCTHPDPLGGTHHYGTMQHPHPPQA